MNEDKRKNLTAVLEKLVPDKNSREILLRLSSMQKKLDTMPNEIDRIVSPYVKTGEETSTQIVQLSDFVSAQLDKIEKHTLEQTIKYGRKFDDVDNKFSTLIEKETTKLDKELRSLFTSTLLKDKKLLEKLIADLKKEIEELYWSRMGNAANNVQSVLNIQSGGVAVAKSVIGINFSNGTVVANPDGTVTYTAPSGAGTYNPKKDTGTVAGTSITLSFTPLANTLVLNINGQFMLEGVDFTLAVASITGLPSWVTGNKYQANYAS